MRCSTGVSPVQEDGPSLHGRDARATEEGDNVLRGLTVLIRPVANGVAKGTEDRTVP